MPHCGKSSLLTNLLCFDVAWRQRVQSAQLKRRGFITLLGGAAAAWPLAAPAQQMPIVGFVYTGQQETTVFVQKSFQQGLMEVGFIEGQNVLVEYRWSGGQDEQLRTFVAEFVRRQILLGRQISIFQAS